MISDISIAEDNTYTLNSLRKTLQCNRRTAEKYIAKGNYKKTVKSYNGSEFDAWIIPENEIRRLKMNLHYTQSGGSVPFETSLNKVITSNDDITSVNSSVTTEMLRNIKELNGRITSLENENRGLQKELKELTSENTVLVRDKATIESKMLLIEDKSKTMEAAYSEQKLEVTRLNKLVRNRNIALIILSAILLTIFSIAICLGVVLSFR